MTSISHFFSSQEKLSRLGTHLREPRVAGPRENRNGVAWSLGFNQTNLSLFIPKPPEFEHEFKSNLVSRPSSSLGSIAAASRNSWEYISDSDVSRPNSSEEYSRLTQLRRRSSLSNMPTRRRYETKKYLVVTSFVKIL